MLFVEKTNFPDRCYHTFLYTKDNNIVALGLLNKCIKYITDDIFESKFKNDMIFIMDTQFDQYTIPKIEYDKFEHKLLDMKEFRKEDTPYPIFFVDPDAMAEYYFDRNSYFANSHRKVVTRFYKNRNIDFSQPYTGRDQEFYNTKLSSDSKYVEENNGKKKYKYMIKNKMEREWINLALRDD